MENRPEPDRSKPCWVLLWIGNTKPQKGQAPGCKLRLVEFEWKSGAWWKTATPYIPVTSFYRANKQADYIGALPHTHRKNLTMTSDTLEKAIPLFEAGKSQREIARLLGIGHGTVQKLLTYWKKAKEV